MDSFTERDGDGGGVFPVVEEFLEVRETSIKL
jgi:hypothetical protein